MTRARFSHHPTTPFMATARLDALWVHDGLLDVRDYKTGQVWTRPRRRRRAGAPAGVGARARSRRCRGLQLRVRSSTSTPRSSRTREAFPPTPTTSSRSNPNFGAQVTGIRSEVAFAGVADADVCHRCSYRSICPDSAVAGVPVWPRGGNGGRGVRRLAAATCCWWGATRRCPRCGSGHLFRRYFTMVAGLPAVRAALRARAGVLGRCAGDQHRNRRRRCSRSCSSSLLAFTVPDVPVGAVLAVLVPLMVLGPIARLPVLEDHLGRRRPRLPPAPRQERTLDEQIGRKRA